MTINNSINNDSSTLTVPGNVTLSSTSGAIAVVGNTGGTTSVYFGPGPSALNIYPSQTTATLTVGGTGGSATGQISLGTGAAAQQIVIGGFTSVGQGIFIGVGSGVNNIQVGSTTTNMGVGFGPGGCDLDGDGTGNLFLYPSQTTGSIIIGGTSSTNTITLNSPNINTIGNVSLQAAGNKLNVATGSNASIGQATLSGGTVTVSTTAVTALSLIFLTNALPSGTAGVLSVGTITAGTSFVINSSTGALDNSLVNYWIIN